MDASILDDTKDKSASGVGDFALGHDIVEDNLLDRDNDSSGSFRGLLQLHAQQCAELMRERPEEFSHRVRMLRRSTGVLFLLSVAMSLGLNAVMVAVGSDIQGLLAANLGTLAMFALSSISYLSDRANKTLAGETLANQARDRITVVLQQIDELVRLKSALTKQKDQWTKSAEESRRSGNELQNEVCQIKEELELVNNQLNEAKLRFSEVHCELQIELEALADTKRQFAQLEAQQATNQDKAESQLREAQSQLAALKSSLESCSTTRTQQEEEVSNLAVKLAELRAELSVAETLRDDHAAEMKSLSVNLATKREEFATRQAELTDVEAELRQQENKRRELEAQVIRLEQKVRENNAAVQAGEMQLELLLGHVQGVEAEKLASSTDLARLNVELQNSLQSCNS